MRKAPDFHGLSRTRQYRIWQDMIQRCYNNNRADYCNYGAKGVTVCPTWRKSFLSFWEDMNDSYFESATIERKDNSKGYSKENCRWATKEEQNRNKSDVRRFPYHGMMLTVAEVAAINGTNHKTTYSRLVQLGWPVARCVNSPSL